MSDRYGKWNSVYVRFRRWADQGVWDLLLPTLVDLGLTDHWPPPGEKCSMGRTGAATSGRGGLARRVLVEAAWALRKGAGPAPSVRAVLSAHDREDA